MAVQRETRIIEGKKTTCYVDLDNGNIVGPPGVVDILKKINKNKKKDGPIDIDLVPAEDVSGHKHQKPENIEIVGKEDVKTSEKPPLYLCEYCDDGTAFTSEQGLSYHLKKKHLDKDKDKDKSKDKGDNCMVKGTEIKGTEVKEQEVKPEEPKELVVEKTDLNVNAEIAQIKKEIAELKAERSAEKDAREKEKIRQEIKNLQDEEKKLVQEKKKKTTEPVSLAHNDAVPPVAGSITGGQEPPKKVSKSWILDHYFKE